MRIWVAVLLSAAWLACTAATPVDEQTNPDSLDGPAETLKDPEETDSSPTPDTEEDLGPEGGVENDEASAEDVQRQEEEAKNDARPGWDVAGYGRATGKSVGARQVEAASACKRDRPLTGTMLSAGSTSTGSGNLSLVILAATVALAAALVAIGALVLRRRRGQRKPGSAERRGPLETVATILGIVSGIFGLAFLVAPDLAPDKSSSRSATMVVRDVEPRIPRGEYVNKTGSNAKLADVDRREIGNVVWLEIGLRGYDGKQPLIQTSLHDPARFYAMIKGSARETKLPRVESQDETRLVPIWVGHPQSEQFEARFRLVQDGQVRQLAGTDEMRAATYRYACDDFVERLAKGS